MIFKASDGPPARHPRSAWGLQRVRSKCQQYCEITGGIGLAYIHRIYAEDMVIDQSERTDHNLFKEPLAPSEALEGIGWAFNLSSTSLATPCTSIAGIR